MQSKATMVGKGTWNDTKSHQVRLTARLPWRPQLSSPPLRRHPRSDRHCETERAPRRPVSPHPAGSDEGGTYRSRGVLPPDETVQDKADAKDDARVQGSCLQEQPQVKRTQVTHQSDASLQRGHCWDKAGVEEAALRPQL